ncbi:sterol homeostasis protein [Dinochytrium kinnereticum]|nr:sterol homeostasis protein [Dinochytrium kinnereticum]
MLDGTQEPPQCVGCGATVAALYTEYSKGNIRLTQCAACGNFADKYIENDVVIVFIDMILQKRPVYRHLLRNRLVYDKWGLNRDILKLAVLLVLFEVYMKWFQLEKAHDRNDFFTTDTSISTQYFYILGICSLEFAAWHIGVRTCVWIYQRASHSIVYFGKLLLILMVIWDYNELEYAWLVNVLVLISNLEALSGGLLMRIGVELFIRSLDPNMLIMIL